METLFEILKITLRLAIIAGVCYYLLTVGLPPRGKGRWRGVPDVLSDRRNRRR